MENSLPTSTPSPTTPPTPVTPSPVTPVPSPATPPTPVPVKPVTPVAAAPLQSPGVPIAEGGITTHSPVALAVTSVAPTPVKKGKKKLEATGNASIDFLQSVALDFAKSDSKNDSNGMTVVFGDEAEGAMIDSKFFVSTGVDILDRIIGKSRHDNGAKGFGTGKVVEIYGAKSSGKSELAQLTMATFLETHQNGIAFYFDQERAVDSEKLKSRPIFTSRRCLYCWSPTAEELFKKIETVLLKVADQKDPIPSIIVIDSVAALITEDEANDTDYKAQVAKIARILSLMFRKLNPILPRTNCLLMFVNQTRANFGGGGGWSGAVAEGGDEETPGGKALKFYADYRLSVKAFGKYWVSETQKKKDAGRPPDGQLVQIRTVKNKIAPPYREVIIPLLYLPIQGEQGMSEVWAVWNLLKKRKQIDSGGKAGYSLKFEPVKKEERRKFHLHEWKEVYTTSPLRPYILQELDRWEAWAMTQTTMSLMEGDGEDEEEGEISAEDELAALAEGAEQGQE